MKNMQMPCTAPLWFDNRDILRLVNAVLCAPSAEAFAECIPVFVKAFCVRHVFGISKRQPAAERRIHHVAVNQSADYGKRLAHTFLVISSSVAVLILNTSPVRLSKYRSLFIFCVGGGIGVFSIVVTSTILPIVTTFDHIYASRESLPSSSFETLISVASNLSKLHQLLTGKE